MEKRIYPYWLVSTLLLCLLCSSCNSDDELELRNPTSFIVKNTLANEIFPVNGPHLRFIFLSNQDGEILYKDSGDEQSSLIEIDVAEGDIVDLTYCYEFDQYFRMETFRDIKSGFDLNSRGKLDYCQTVFDNQISSLEDDNNLQLVINGMNDYEEIYLPFGLNHSFERQENGFYSSNAIIKDSINNNLTINGQSWNRNSHFLVIRPANQNIYLGIYLDRNDWEATNFDNVSKTIQLEDFLELSPYKINTDQVSNWSLRADMLLEDETIISLPTWLKPSIDPDYDTNSDYVFLFIPQNIDFQELNLNFRGSSSRLEHTYNRIYSELPPQNIDLYDPIIDTDHLTYSDYSINTNTEDNRFITTYYRYNQDGGFSNSSWAINSMPTDASLEYQLPSVPSDFLQSSNILKNHITSPRDFSIILYDGTDLDIPYEGTKSVAAYKSCMDFNTKRVTLEF